MPILRKFFCLCSLVLCFSCGEQNVNQELDVNSVAQQIQYSGKNLEKAALWEVIEQAVEMEDFKLATSYLDTLTFRYPNCSECLFNAANLNLKMGNYKAAFLLLQNKQALEGDPEICAIRGQALFELGAFEESIESLSCAIEHLPDSIALTLRRGVAQYKTGRLTDAAKDFNSVLQSEPLELTALTYLGKTYSDLELPDSSLFFYSQILDNKLELSPTSMEDMIDNHIRLGKLKMQNSNFGDALEQFTRVINLDPLNQEAFYQRGLIKVKFDRIYEGCEDLGKAFENGHPLAQDVIQLYCQDYLY